MGSDYYRRSMLQQHTLPAGFYVSEAATIRITARWNNTVEGYDKTTRVNLASHIEVTEMQSLQGINIPVTVNYNANSLIQ